MAAPAVEVHRATAPSALPPLNRCWRGDLIARTRIAPPAGRLPRPRRRDERRSSTRADADLAAGSPTCPEIAELDINPLLADAHGVIALDARIRVARAPADGASRWRSGPIRRSSQRDAGDRRRRSCCVRPIRPEDEPRLARSMPHASPRTCGCASSGAAARCRTRELARFTQIDYDREMAFVALAPATGSMAGRGAGRLRSRTTCGPSSRCRWPPAWQGQRPRGAAAAQAAGLPARARHAGSDGRCACRKTRRWPRWRRQVGMDVLARRARRHHGLAHGAGRLITSTSSTGTVESVTTRLRDAAHQGAADHAVAVRAHHDHVGLVALRGLHDFVGRMADRPQREA